MTRGLPISIFVHAVTIGLVLMFGNTVHQKPFETPRTIGVKLVELPKVQPSEELPEDLVENIEPPKPRAKEPEALPPKEVPQPKPEPKNKPEPKEEEKPKDIIPDVEPESSDDPDDVNEEEDTPIIPLATGNSVAGTDADFPFAWYLSVMEGQIGRNWNPRQMGFRNDSGIGCVLHFIIQRNGAIGQVTLVRESGVGVYDREALRAVQSTRLPQLPANFGANSLGVTMTFNLESGGQ
ncbi:MAG: TonB family protein [bacterium]|nr:TonB family protein [bacterium]